MERIPDEPAKRFRFVEQIKIENDCKVSGFYAGIFKPRKPDPAPPHSHPGEVQLVFPTKGSFTIKTVYGSWFVPGGSGVWIPSGVVHEILWKSNSELLSLYFRKDLVHNLYEKCFVFPLSPLMRELVLKFCVHYDKSEVEKLHNLFRVILDEVSASHEEPFFLPWPKDKRLKKLLDIIMDNPEQQITLAEIAGKAGASQRTLLRLSQKELHMSLQLWRDQWRFLKALELLHQGKSVSQVAIFLGFENSSGLRKLFHRLGGSSPCNFT